MEIAPILNLLKELDERRLVLVDYLDYPTKKDRLEEVSRELEAPKVWDDPVHAQALGRDAAQAAGRAAAQALGRAAAQAAG